MMIHPNFIRLALAEPSEAMYRGSLLEIGSSILSIAPKEMCHRIFCAHMGCTASTESHVASIGSGGSVFGTARDGDVAGGGCYGFFAGGVTEVSLVMILVGTLVATGAKLTPVATLESRWTILVYFVQ